MIKGDLVLWPLQLNMTLNQIPQKDTNLVEEVNWINECAVINLLKCEMCIEHLKHDVRWAVGFTRLRSEQEIWI